MTLERMRAMILAAGYGTRLWPLTIDRAKPAIPFMNRPLVGYVAEYLARFGCDEVVVNLHHRPESVRAALGDGSRFGVRLHFVEEPEILGTSGALDNARHLLDGGTFVVVNGKLATDIDLHAALETHRRQNAIATLVLRENAERERYSTVQVRDGLIHGFGPAPAPQTSDNADGQALRERSSQGCSGVPSSPAAFEADAPLMFTGIQILEPRIFDFIPPKVFSHSTTDVYPKAWNKGERVAAHVSGGMWYELSTVRRYLETSLHLLKMQGRGVEVGDGSDIEAGAEVSESVLWEDVKVERGATVRRAVLGAGVRVPAGERLEEVAVVRADLVRGVERPEKGLEGEVRGANFVAPLPR
ncbi:MAG TPA: NDP-sugar synthase [Pyrinomonadaceae bacterium]|nr:NDP-sugar synthase [Pyrinomonadaceae bacterium]